MVKKKVKSTKQQKRKDSWQGEDVQVETGLPPKVEGQLRCFCRLSLNKIRWEQALAPQPICIRVKWWGEDGPGALFSPDTGQQAQEVRTTARYPVRSGPKQFASYLQDMGSLVMEVLVGPSLSPIGHVEINQVGLLSPMRPVKGWYPIFSQKMDKIGDIHVELMLESLMESYDSTGSIPTTDVSMETHGTQESMFPQTRQPIPHELPPTKPEEDPFISPASHQNGVPSSFANHTQDLRKQLNYSLGDVGEHQRTAVRSGSTVAITTNGDIVTTHLTNGYPPAQMSSQVPAGSSTEKDLLSVLLERGNRLRNEMIISTVSDSTDSKEMTNSREMSVGNELARSSSQGSLLKEILKADKGSSGFIGGNQSGMEDNTVDLVFGGDLVEDIRALHNFNSPHSSISEDMNLSDPADPIHSESILQELFYKNPESETSGLSGLSADEEYVTEKVHKSKAHSTSMTSLEDPANARPASRRSSISSTTFPEPEEKSKTPVKKKKKKTSSETGLRKRTPSESSLTPKRKARSKVKKSSKKRRRSRSSSRGASGESESEVGSTPRSEISQVSFDMPPSDVDEPEEETKHHNRKKSADCLSVERLTLLGRVHVARVVVDKLLLLGYDLNSSLSRSKQKSGVGKPPKPVSKFHNKSITYFVEYQFPVVATSRDKYTPNAMATEVMRVVSKNIKDGVVTFGHRSVFPIMFDGSVVEKWWKSALVFKLYARSPGQKVPSLVGSCGVPLKSILRSEDLHIERTLEIRESGRANSSLNSSLRSSDSLFGNLKVNVELASDNKDFASCLARAKLAEMTGKAKMVPVVPPPPPPPAPVVTKVTVSQGESCDQGQPSVQPYETSNSVPNTMLTTIPPVSSANSQISEPTSVQQRVFNPHPQPYLNGNMNGYLEQPTMTLHTLLMIPEGHNVTVQGIPSLMAVRRHGILPPVQPSSLQDGAAHRDHNVRNTYLVCRMFWCNDSVHSGVCWGTFEPEYNFVQVAPVLMTKSLLERMRNNFMIVEVWDKKTSAENDKLVGMVKLSLHQFYMSFRDQKISQSLLKSQFPVVSVDNYLPIVDPLTGSQYGQLKVLLAMGSAEQITHVQRVKQTETSPEKPSTFLERRDLKGQDTAQMTRLPVTEGSTEHLFEVVIEGVRGLSLFDNMIWGEADCFVQYHFPVQTGREKGQSSVVGMTSMRSYRTATTLCMPDPSFNDVTRHRLVLSADVPVQRELLTACANSGGGAGGIPFEVWCRYYHPNIRDQCIAKSSLPLAKLCAMITMQKRGEPSVQSFALQLTQVSVDSNSPDSKHKVKDSGLLDVTIHYRSQTAQVDGSSGVNKNLANSQVCLSVSIQKATGLKSAAESLARSNPKMQYPSEVGVNAYVKVIMSFLMKEDARLTRTVARTFAPEFCHHMDFPCPLLWTEADSDALSLAQILETADVTLETWHQVPGSGSDLDRHVTTSDIHGRKQTDKNGDVLLGTTIIPLKTLLTHRTGINGWFSINLCSQGWEQDHHDNNSSQPHGNRGLDRVVGGLEMCIKFAHHTDREQVVHAARGVGWSPVDLDVEDEEEWMSEGEDSGPFDQLTVHIDQVSFPLHSALVAGQNQLDKSTTCYVRYKFYDRNAVVSKSVKPKILETGYIMCNCQHKHEFQVPVSSPYKWYLREEQLEVQVWVGYGRKEGGAKPQHRDKLIGTAYLDLEGLNNMRRKTLRVSGMYPLFKPGASSMGGAFVRAHVTAKPLLGPLSQKKKSDEEDSDEEVEEEEIDAEYDSNDSFHQIKFKKKEPAKSAADQTSLEPVTEELAQNFMVMISVERALHLPKVVDKTSGDEYLPNTYVSYQTAETQGPSYTHVFYNSDNPTWDHEHETKLSTQHLFHDNKSLVFKVWHKPHGSSKEPNKSMDRVIGYVSVDLTPLTSGLTQICGWYNITDFSGQCKGQMKVNIVPQEETSTFGRKEPPSSARSTSSNPHTSQAFFPATSVSSLFQESSSLPLQPFTSLLPGFDPRVHSIQDQTDQLQQQLSDHIKTFLRQQEEKMQMPSSQEEDKVPEPSIHWQPPSMTDYQMEGNPSRSLMFGSLRKQLQELDDLTNRLKNKLVVTSNVPQSSAQLLSSLASRDSNSPMSSLPLTSTKQEVELLLLTGSNEAESSQQTAADSGAFSVTQSSERYHEALDSNRSDRNDSNRSDRLLDSLRLGSSSHKFSEPEVITQNATPREGLSSLRSSPRDAQNNSDTGIHMAFATPRDDEMSTGGFNLTGKDSGYTPRECSSTDVTPRDLSVVYEVNESRASSEANSIGFFGQDSLSPKPSSANVNKNNSSSINLGPQQKDMGAILEQEDDSDNDEKFYHRYRDALDQQAHQEEDLEDSREEDDEDSIIRPRTLNDVSGKFGGIPGHSVVGNSAMYGSPREFTQSSHTMPFDVRTLQSERSHRSVERQVESASEIEEEIEEQSDEGTLEEEEINKRHGRSSFLEKDSWFSEGEHDRSGIRANSHTVSTNAEGSYSKQNEPKKEIDMIGSLLMCQRFEGSLLQSTGADLEGDEEYEDDFESYHTSSKSSRSQSNMPCHDQSDSEVETPRSSRNRSGQSSRPNSGDSACSRTMTRSLKSSRNSSLTPRSGTVSRSHSAGSQRSRTQDVADDVDVQGEDPSCKSPHEAYTEVVHQLDVMFAHNKDAEPVGVEAGSNRHDHMTNGFLSDSEEESASVPNFFMPPQHMEESMKALKKATAQFPSAGAWEKQKDEERVKSKAEAAMEMRNKLMGQRSSTVGTKGRAPPTAEEAKRIARIFSEKFS